jgi:hypothetical protein
MCRKVCLFATGIKKGESRGVKMSPPQKFIFYFLFSREGVLFFFSEDHSCILSDS